MSRLEVPLLSKKLWATGDLVLRAELDLLIRDENGTWRPVTFRVDSGTEMTSKAAARARALDLPIPRQRILLDVSGVRREVRAGFFRAQVVGMDGTEHLFRVCRTGTGPEDRPGGTRPSTAGRDRARIGSPSGSQPDPVQSVRVGPESGRIGAASG